MESGKHKSTWNPWSSFDVSAAEIDKIKRRQALIAENKAEFRRMTIDPKTSLSGGRGGHFVDPALQRWYSSRRVFHNYFIMNKKSVGYLFFGLILPVFTLYHVTMKGKRELDARARAGLVTGKERASKAFLW